MDLILIYTIAILVILLLFYPAVKCLRCITWRLMRRYPRLYRAFRKFFNSYLPYTFNFLPLLLLSMIPGTVQFAQNIRYPLLIPRRYWMSVTRLECVILALYFGANSAILILRKANLGPTAAMLAVINAVMLFLGGRTSPLADLIGIPLSTYYVFHHFIGRVVVIEGVIHAGLAFRRSRPDQTTTSGYIAFGGLLLILFTSFYLWRRYSFRSFAKVHLILALAILGSTAWHVLSRTAKQPKIIVLASGGVWVLTTIYTWMRLLFFATAATITDKTGDLDDDFEVSRITVSCNRRFRHFPGSYFYIFPSGSFFHYNLLASYPMAVLWYEPDLEKERSELALLVVHTRPLQSLRFRENERLLIDGPYGQDLQLEYFESVMLAAHGAGISGVLSIARSLWERRRSDDVLRRVNIFWSLEQNSQGEWAATYLRRLQKLDAGNELFVAWCVYPSEVKKQETPVFRETSHWLYFDRNDRDLLLKHMMDATSGKSMVVACGDPDFSATVREAAIDRRATQPIDFVEVQYRPSNRLSRAVDDANSGKGKDKLSTTDTDLEKGRGKLTRIKASKKRGKRSTTNDVDLEKGISNPRKIGEDEQWDDITLYSPTTVADGESPLKASQKKTD